jgi:hypothetical protein
MIAKVIAATVVAGFLGLATMIVQVTGRPERFWDIVPRVGWEMSFLGIGLTVGIVAGARLVQAPHLGARLVALVMAGNVGLGIVAMHLMIGGNLTSVGAGRLALGLGNAALALSVALGFLARGLDGRTEN